MGRATLGRACAGCQAGQAQPILTPLGWISCIIAFSFLNSNHHHIISHKLLYFMIETNTWATLLLNMGLTLGLIRNSQPKFGHEFVQYYIGQPDKLSAIKLKK